MAMLARQPTANPILTRPIGSGDSSSIDISNGQLVPIHQPFTITNRTTNFTGGVGENCYPQNDELFFSFMTGNYNADTCLTSILKLSSSLTDLSAGIDMNFWYASDQRRPRGPLGPGIEVPVLIESDCSIAIVTQRMLWDFSRRQKFKMRWEWVWTMGTDPENVQFNIHNVVKKATALLTCLQTGQRPQAGHIASGKLASFSL